jgi:2-methylcitrate dehydratase PrpD
MKLARHFAERITALRYEDLPPEAVTWSKVAVMDTLGVMLAGSCEEAPHLVEDVLGIATGNGPCLIVGSDRRAGPLDAALINGTAAHVLDFDNTAAHMGGHVSAVMVPALLAAAEAFNSSGRDLLLGHVAGYEVGARIGQSVNFYHTELGWHPTWTIGVFAVTAACARMLNLSTDETETALAMATSLAGGTKANFGTMTKSLHAGSCARNGLLAVMLARKGFTANPNAFEHKQGFFEVFNGKGNYDAARATAHWADPLDIVVPGASYKLYPCCYSTHAAIEAALNIVRKHGRLDPKSIARVESHTADVRLMHTDRPVPNSELDAKFSVQYCVLRALIDGRVVMEHFENEAYREPVVRELLPRVQAIALKGIAFDNEDPFNALVRVTLTDGTTLESTVDFPLGRTSANPIALADLTAKFENCAARVLPVQSAKAVAHSIDSMETLKSVRDLMAMVVSAVPVRIRRSA